MWQREQKKSRSKPWRKTVYFSVRRLNVEEHSHWFAKGLCAALRVQSGGSGVSHSPLSEVPRASARKAARQTGSRQAFDIIDPFHSSKIFWWQVLHCAGLSCCSQCSW